MSDLDPMAAAQFLAPESETVAESPSPVIAETADYTARTLTPKEFTTRAKDFAHYPAGLPNPETSVVVFVEEKATGRVMASHTIQQFPFLEGLWVAPDARGHQTDIHRLLWGSMLAMLSALNIAHPLTLAQDPAILALARKAGFQPIAGTLLKLE